MLALPPLDPGVVPAATYLAATLHALAREEHVGRRRRRLLEPDHATWHRFRGRLGPRAFVELLLEDAAVSQATPFDVAAILGSDDALESIPESVVADWLAALPRLALDAPARDYLDDQARLLGLTGRPAFSELSRIVQPHERVLELPGTGGRLAAHIVQTQPGLSLRDVFTILYGSWQERTLAGIVAVEAGVIGEMRIHEDPSLTWARQQVEEGKAAFSMIIGLRPEKGGRFEVGQLRHWFQAVEHVPLV